MTGADDDDDSRSGASDPIRQLLALGIDLPSEGTGARRRLHADLPTAVAVDDRDTDAVEAPAAEPVEAPAGVAAPREPVPRSRSLAFAAALTALVLAGIGLAYAGVVTVRDSTAGKRLDPSTDPSAPGFEGFVEPTPTLLVLQEKSGALVGATMISLKPGELGGAVVFIPVRTLTELPKFGTVPAAYAYDGGGSEPAALVLRNLLGIGFTEVVEVDTARWAELVAPVAPLTVENPDDVTTVGPDGSERVVFRAGTVQLQPADVGTWLEATVDGESDLNRLFRHQLFWQSWISAITKANDPVAVPGEGDAGLSHFARALAAGATEEYTLPVKETAGAFDERGGAFQADPDAVADLLNAIVPYPISPEAGKRPRVRLLNGTTRKGLPGEVASVLVPAGAEISIVGNAESFEEEKTTIVYYDSAQAAATKRLAKALGVGKIELKRRPNDAVDVTIVLGADYLEAAGLSSVTTVTTGG